MNQKINFTKSILAILAIFVLAAFASAADTNITVQTLPDSVNSGATFTVKFSITNNIGDLTNLNVSYSDSKTAPFASLTSVQVGSTTYTPQSSSDTLNTHYKALLTGTSLENETTSEDFTLTFLVNSNAVSQTFSREIIIKAISDDSNEVINVVAIPLSIFVNPQSPASSISLVLTPNPITTNQTAALNVTNTGDSQLNSISLTSTGNFLVTFSSSGFSLSPQQSRNVQVIPSDLSNIKFGDYSSTITATSSNGVVAQTTLNLKKGFCRNGAQGNNLSISEFEINSNSDDDDNEWKPLTEVTVTVGVENLEDDRISSIYVDLGLFDENGKNVVKDLEFESEDDYSIKLGSLDDNDDGEVEFQFTVPADFDAGSYKLTAKAYSKGSGLSEDEMCVDTASDFETSQLYTPVSVDREDDDGKFITFTDVSLSPSQVSCGSRATLNFDAINIGDEDQDQVRVKLENSELGISLSNEIKSDLDSGDSQPMTFTFTVPSNAASKGYDLLLTAEYDYRSGSYHDFSEDPYYVRLNVICSNTPSGGDSNVATLITASLADNSEAKAGSKMTVNARITNMGTNSSNVIISAKDYESWAVLDSISERLVVLNPGQSKDVQMVFTVNSDASGEKSFKIDTLSDGDSESKNVVVDIAGSGNTSGLFASLGGSWIWIIGLVNLVLIILIIVVAFRVSRR